MVAGGWRKKIRLKEPQTDNAYYCFPLWYPQGLDSRQSGMCKWTLVWTEFPEGTSRSSSAPESELLKLRGDAEVPLPLLPFSPFPASTILWQHDRGYNSKGARLWEKGAFCSVGGAVIPREWAEPSCLFFSLSSLPPLDPVDSRAGELKPQHSGQRTKEGSSGAQKLLENCREEGAQKVNSSSFCELLGLPSSAHMGLISNGHTKGLENWTKTRALPGLQADH